MTVAKPREVFSEEALAELRSRIGVRLPRQQAWNEVATKDAIRHFAHGYGDTNPLWCSEEYAQRTRYGGIIAPPTFLYSCLSSGSSRAGAMGLPGAHGLWAGEEWEWFRPARVGDRITDETKLVDLRPVHGQFADPMYEQIGETTFRNQRDELLAIERQIVWRFERLADEKRDRYAGITKHRYTPEEIAAIQADCDKEQIRGANPRYWEEVQVGEEIPHVVKGPLTVTDIMAFKMGMGASPFVRAHGIRMAYERRHPTTAVLNSYGIPDVPERVHWEDELAQTVGIPAAYDYGYQRVTWMAQVITNWMGDDGFLRKLAVQIRRPNLVNDTLWCRGRVVNKQIKDGEHQVECELWGDNQRREISTTGHATVALPAKGGRTP